MKKLMNLSLAYLIAALAAGVFYREFTKLNGFEGETMLRAVHTHLFMLGMVVFLLVALFDAKLSLRQSKLYKLFVIVYNIGVPLASVMMLVRGVLQVAGVTVSAGADGAVAGISGVGHVVTAAGIVLFFVMLLGALKEKKAERSDAGAAENGEETGE